MIVRAVDEVRFGFRVLEVEELRTLAAAWSLLQEGDTPSEAALRYMPKDLE